MIMNISCLNIEWYTLHTKWHRLTLYKCQLPNYSGQRMQCVCIYCHISSFFFYFYFIVCHNFAGALYINAKAQESQALVPLGFIPVTLEKAREKCFAYNRWCHALQIFGYHMLVTKYSVIDLFD